MPARPAPRASSRAARVSGHARPAAVAAGRRSTMRATRPGRGVMTTIRSARRTASGTLCVTRITVRGRSSQSACSSASNVSRRQRVERAERLVQQQHRRVADQGPGQRRRAAPSRRTARAAAGRRLRQPDPRQRLAGALRRSSAATPAEPSGSATLSSVDRHGRGAAAGRRCPPARHPGAARRRRPSTAPASGRSRPAISRSSVLLPQPFGPMTTVNEPAATLEAEAAERSTAPSRADKAQRDIVELRPAGRWGWWLVRDSIRAP